MLIYLCFSNMEIRVSICTFHEILFIILEKKILSSDSDSIGVVLYNKQVIKNHMNLNGIHAPRTKEFLLLSQISQSQWGHSEALLVDELWLCHDLLARIKNPANRQILIFTDEDRPNPKNQMTFKQPFKERKICHR